MMDKRAIDILFSKYWSSAGWKAESARSVSTEDFEFAKSRGVMFDPVRWDHDELVSEAMRLAVEIDPKDVANSFVASLGTRQLDNRSALGSYAALRNIRKHTAPDAEKPCRTCGSYRSSRSESEDLNVLNFERLKWGGVRHLQPVYAVFDLQQFERAERAEPLPEQIALLVELLLSFEAVSDETTSARLEKAVPKSLRSNKQERDVLIGVLGIASVLGTREHAGFLRAFVDADRRELPDRRFIDMPYPACWWVGADGINWDAAEWWFGHLSPTIRSTRSRLKRAPG